MKLLLYFKALETFLREKLRKFIHPGIYKENSAVFENRRVFYSAFLSEGDKVFDVGANLGNRVEVFLSLNNKVVAIEPQLYCYYFLKMKYFDRINLLNIAVGAQKDKMLMYINSQSSTISTLSTDFIKTMKENRFKNQNWNRTQEVLVDTLDSLIEKHGIPKFIKIDVEGFEPEVLKGLSYKIDYLCFEYSIPEQTDNINFCLSLINKISPQYCFNVSIEETNRFIFDKWITYDEIINLLKGNIKVFENFGDVYAKLNV